MVTGLSKFIYNEDKSYLVDRSRKDFCKVGGLNDFVLRHSHYMLVEKIDNDNQAISSVDDIISDDKGNKYLILYSNFELWVNSFN